MRFTVRGRDRKYEIRNTKLQPMSNAERPVQNVEGRYNVQSTKYTVGIRIGIGVLVFKDLACLSADRVLGTWYFVQLSASCFLILDTWY